VKRAGRLALGFCAAVAWIALAAINVAAFRGGARTPLDYASRTIVNPLADSDTLSGADSRRAFWSGWRYDAPRQMHVSTWTEPEIVFVRTAAGGDCTATLAALADIGGRQRAFVSLNGGAASEITIDGDRSYRVHLDGTAASGVNVLSFRLPDAQSAAERLRAIAVRSVSFACAASGPA